MPASWLALTTVPSSGCPTICTATPTSLLISWSSLEPTNDRDRLAAPSRDGKRAARLARLVRIERGDSREQAVEWFDVAHVGKGPSRFDPAKLLNLNGHYIREAGDARLAELVAPLMQGAVYTSLLTRAMPVLKVRAKDLHELAASAGFLFATRPLLIEDKAAALLTDANIVKALPRGAVAAALSRTSGVRALSLMLIAPAGLGRAIDPVFLGAFPALTEPAETEAL